MWSAKGSCVKGLPVRDQCFSGLKKGGGGINTSMSGITPAKCSDRGTINKLACFATFL